MQRGYSPISAPYYYRKVCGKRAALLRGLFTEVPGSYPYSITFAKRPAGHCSAGVSGSHEGMKPLDKLGERRPKARSPNLSYPLLKALDALLIVLFGLAIG